MTQLTPCWPYGVNIRYQVNDTWCDLEYVFRLIFRSKTESDLHFALQNSQHTFWVTIWRGSENHRLRKYWFMARFPLCNAQLSARNHSNKRWINERNWVRDTKVARFYCTVGWPLFKCLSRSFAPFNAFSDEVWYADFKYRNSSSKFGENLG